MFHSGALNSIQVGGPWNKPLLAIANVFSSMHYSSVCSSTDWNQHASEALWSPKFASAQTSIMTTSPHSHPSTTNENDMTKQTYKRPPTRQYSINQPQLTGSTKSIIILGLTIYPFELHCTVCWGSPTILRSSSSHLDPLWNLRIQHLASFKVILNLESELVETLLYNFQLQWGMGINYDSYCTR